MADMDAEPTDANMLGGPAFSGPSSQPSQVTNNVVQDNFQIAESYATHLDSDDDPDTQYAVTRDSIHRIISFFEDAARDQARGIASKDIASFWAPLGALFNSLSTSWNGAVTTLQLPHLRLASPCPLPHNAPCTKPHNSPCTRQHVENQGKVLVPNTQPTMAQKLSAQEAARPKKPFNVVPITAVVPNVMQTYDLSQDILARYKSLCEEGYEPKVAARLILQDAPRKRPKPSTYNTPKDANKTIYVKLPALSVTDRANLPLPGHFADALRAHLANNSAIPEWCRTLHRDLVDKMVCNEGHKMTLPALSHVVITAHSVNYVFNALIPHASYNDINAFLTYSCAAVTRNALQQKFGPTTAPITADTFHHRSTVVFNNILPFDDAGNRREKDFIADLYENSVWKSFRIFRANFWHPPSVADSNSAGCLFVEFQDDKAKSNLRRIVRTRSRIGDDYFPCSEVRPSSKTTNAPQCGSCLRWGHPQGRYTSHFSNCAVCAGAHKTTQHTAIASNAPVKCFNCGGAHHADHTSCIFFEKRSDRRWLFDNAPKFDRVKKTWIYYNTRKSGEARTVHAA